LIPKRIFYAWFGGNPKPLDVQQNIQSWSTLNPDFEIVEINESNFDVNSMVFTREAYSEKKWAFVSDVARIYFVYTYGGIYLDTDVELIKPLGPFVKNRSFWAMENSNSINSGLGFGSEKGNKLIGTVLNYYGNHPFSKQPIDKVMTVPIVTKVFRDHGFKFKNKKQFLDDGTAIYPTQIFAPLHFWGGGSVGDNTVAIHHYSASWRNGKATEGAKRLQMLRWRLTYYAPGLVELIDLLRGRPV
jgi:hypothetical protein